VEINLKLKFPYYNCVVKDHFENGSTFNKAGKCIVFFLFISKYIVVCIYICRFRVIPFFSGV